MQIVHPRGVEEFVGRLVENKTLVHPKPIMIKGTRDKIIVEIGLHYTDTYNEQLLCYTNAVPNPDGGTHSQRLPRLAHARDQSIREEQQSDQRQGARDHRQRRARRPRRGGQREASRPALRVARPR